MIWFGTKDGSGTGLVPLGLVVVVFPGVVAFPERVAPAVHLQQQLYAVVVVVLVLRFGLVRGDPRVTTDLDGGWMPSAASSASSSGGSSSRTLGRADATSSSQRAS